MYNYDYEIEVLHDDLADIYRDFELIISKVCAEMDSLKPFICDETATKEQEERYTYLENLDLDY